MPGIISIISEAINTYVVSGAIGGMSSGIFIREGVTRVAMMALTGAAASYYLTPSVLWILGAYFDLPVHTDSELQNAAPDAVGFLMGMFAMKLLSIMEVIFNKKAKDLLK